MEKLTQIACYLVSAYENITSSKFNDSELTLHKLMYFAQKTSYALVGEPLFEEEFQGWRHGHVLTELRFFFEDYPRLKEEYLNLTETEKYIIDNTIYNYGKYAAWTLRDMSHEEESWKKSRKGLSAYEQGYRTIPNEDIKNDSLSYRIYDHQYDMYLDEFDDVVEEEFEYVQ